MLLCKLSIGSARLRLAVGGIILYFLNKQRNCLVRLRDHVRMFCIASVVFIIAIQVLIAQMKYFVHDTRKLIYKELHRFYFRH